MALLKDGTRIYGTLYANTEVVIGSLNVASQIATVFNQANSANNMAQSAYNAANTAAANTVYLQTINNTQNTNITAVNTFAQAAYNKANTGVSTSTDQFARDTANTAAANTVYLQTINNTQNSQIAVIQGVDLTQNTRLDSADDLARSAYGQANVGATFVGNGGTISGNVTIQGSLSVSGNVTYTGNVTSVAVTGNTGQFFGYAANGFNALYAGIPTGYLIEPQTVFQVTSNYNGYAGLNMQNINQGNLSSADFFITADNGSVENTFLDLGLASSTYNYPGYGLIKPNDGYWIVYGNTTTGGGNAIIATGATNDIVFATKGVDDANVVMRITAANTVVVKSDIPTSSKTTGALQVAGGVGVQGDIQATNVYSQGTNVLDYVQGTNATQNTNITAVNTFASASYNQANASGVLAQAAYDKANTGVSTSTDQYARDTANTASANTVYLQTINDSQNTSISFLNVYTQAAFDKANTGGGGTGLTYTANVSPPAGPTVGDQWYKTDTNVLYEYINDGTSNNWVDVISPTVTSNPINISTTFAQMAYDKANSANVLAQSAYNQANSEPIGASAFNKANSANVLAQAAFDRANTAVSSTIGKSIAMAIVFGG